MLIKLDGVKKQILISACMYLGQILIGFSTTWPGPIFPKLRDLDQSPLQYLISETEISLVGSLVYIGSLPGPYVMGWLSNVKGRKPCLIVGGVLITFGYAVLAFAKNLAMLYSGRVLVGAGLGIIGVMNLVYIGEIASVHIRGILLTVLGIFTTCGSILLFSVGPFFSYTAVTSVGLALSIAFTLSAVLIPETPIFYLLKDKEDDVREKLRDLGRENDTEKILASKKEFINTTTKKDWLELVTLRSNRRALFIVIIVNIIQQCSGILAVIAFSASIFEIAGSSISADVAMIIIGFCQVSGSGTAPFFIERNGRKKLMLLSCIVCSLSMLILGLYFYFDQAHYSGINKLKWLPLVILIIYFFGYDIGLGIVPNVLIGEMFTTNVRSKGSAVAMSSSWVLGFLVMTAYGSVVENFGSYVAFWFFSIICMCGVFFTMFFVPETKGKSLIEIQDILSKKR